MKIGFYGGMVNNMYTMFYAAKRLKYPAYFIRDREDSYVMHQPFWLDCKIYWESSGQKNDLYSQDWTYCENKVLWKKKGNFIDPLEYRGNNVIASQCVKSIKNFIARLFFFRRLLKTGVWKNNLGALEEMDVLIVCGCNAILNACVSGKPFFIWSHGGDIRYALGLEKKPDGIVNRFYDYMTRKMLTYAFKNCLGVLSNDVTEIYLKGSPDITKAKKNIKTKNTYVLPLPQYKAEDTNDNRVCKIASGKITVISFDNFLPQATEEKIKIFVPSRFDPKWKGQDLLLEAISKMENKSLFHLLFTAYGDNFEELRECISFYKLENNTTLIKGVFSRPLLFEMYKKSNLIVDQFKMGTFGAITMEAFSIPVPVIAYINEGEFQANPSMIPPVFNCKSISEIQKQLVSIIENPNILTQKKKEISYWYESNLGDKIFKKRLDSLLEKV